jgi:hypothetical protein
MHLHCLCDPASMAGMILRGQSMTKPMGLTVSALFMVLSMVLGIVLSPTIPVPTNVTRSSNVDSLLGWVFIALEFLVIYFYWDARNWARLVTLICSGWFLLGLIMLSLLPIPWIHHAMWGRPLFFVRTVGDSLLAIYLLWYLNTRAIRAWFKRRPILVQAEPISN